MKQDFELLSLLPLMTFGESVLFNCTLTPGTNNDMSILKNERKINKAKE